MMENRKIFFATTNPAKVKNYKEKLKEKNIDLLTINDLENKIEINENGKNALENAMIKAKAYYDIVKIPTIGMDNSLFIKDIPEEKQPGTNVRRVNGKRLTDEEMIEYYTNLVKEYGEKLIAKWVFGLVVYNGKKAESMTWSRKDFYFVDTPCNLRNPGYPLDSISIVPEVNKYLVELTEEEKRKNDLENEKKDNTEEVIKFIIKNAF